jgi:hypothetical protein
VENGLIPPDSNRYPECENRNPERSVVRIFEIPPASAGARIEHVRSKDDLETAGPPLDQGFGIDKALIQPVVRVVPYHAI